MATVEKRPLTEEELAEAARLRAAWLKYKDVNLGATQEWLGAVTELGSQGLIGQYLRGIIPLNLPALVSICRQIGADPRYVSPRLARFLDEQDGGKRGGASGLTTEKAAAGDVVSPDISKRKAGVKNAFSPELRSLFDRLESAERDGWLTSDVVETLNRVLQLAAPSVKRPLKRHTEHSTLDEDFEGQGNEQGKAARRPGRQAKAG